MKFSFSAFLFAAALCVVCGHGEHGSDQSGWKELGVRLPKPLSDHSATAASDGLIYIAGGCDAVDGNVYIPIDEQEGFFACSSLSSSFYSFDPITSKFEELPEMLRQRYRHSGIFVGKQLWLVGGRTIEDVLIPEIDVFDTKTKSWSSTLLPAEYQVSDHAGFALEPSYIYIAGGYDQNYTALDFLTRIDASSLGSETLSVEPMAPLRVARGDIIGTADADGLSAYVAGGFTHANGFCAPLGSTEQYVFADDKWNNLPPLVRARGEVVLLEHDNHLYALGGERQIEGFCEGAGDGLDPGELTVGTDEVEFYEEGNNAWNIVAGFPNQKFRFAAAVGSDGLFYAFGGQTAHDPSCQCFKTTDGVSVFVSDISSAAPAKLMASSLLAIGAMGVAMSFFQY